MISKEKKFESDEKAEFINQVSFELVPVENTMRKGGFGTPRGHYFRGIFLKWMKHVDDALGNSLHSDQPKKSPLFIRKYSIQQDLMYQLDNTRGNRNKKPIIGVKYTVNAIGNSISEAMIQLILSNNQEKVRYGCQEAWISKIEFHQQSLQQLYSDSEPLTKFELKFLSPTSFNLMGMEREMRFPHPATMFGNIARMWNSTASDIAKIPMDFYDWISVHVHVVGYKLQTKAWEIGKPVKAVGFLGSVSMLVDVNENSKKDVEYARWLHVLLKLGVFSGTGKNRTAGFGRYEIKFLKKLIKN